MNPMLFGVVAGMAFGVANVAMMAPLDFPDKRAALIGAFASRFAIGFLIPIVKMPMPSWVIGAFVGLLISLPDAIITRNYGPILITGIVGGLVIGWASGRFVE